jgi:DNA-directed RNA polymerase specialized sigma24 family protein
MASSSEGEVFREFLFRLSPQPEEAGRIYEHLRRALCQYFANRGCGGDVEALVDIALDRLAAKVGQDTTLSGDSVRALAYGIARYVRLEHSRRPHWVTLAPEPITEERDSSDKEQRSACLNHCLMLLSEADRELITKYYQDDGRKKIDSRRTSAAKHELTAGALRVRLWKIRQRLRSCIENCMQRNQSDNTSETYRRYR